MLKNLYLIVGASGTGKTTLANNLAQHYNTTVVQSYTTRKKRFFGETGHLFVSEEDFKKVPKNDILAYTYFNNTHYWVTAEQLENSDFYIIDPAGIIYLYKMYKGRRPIVVLGLQCDKQTIIDRLTTRDGEDTRTKNDEHIFTDEVMKLISDELIDVSENSDIVLNKVIKIIDKYETED